MEVVSIGFKRCFKIKNQSYCHHSESTSSIKYSTYANMNKGILVSYSKRFRKIKTILFNGRNSKLINDGNWGHCIFLLHTIYQSSQYCHNNKVSDHLKCLVLCIVPTTAPGITGLNVSLVTCCGNDKSAWMNRIVDSGRGLNERFPCNSLRAATRTDKEIYSMIEKYPLLIKILHNSGHES